MQRATVKTAGIARNAIMGQVTCHRQSKSSGVVLNGLTRLFIHSFIHRFRIERFVLGDLGLIKKH